jgi:hypothetical protein
VTRVTDLDDARTNKALDIPVTTPVEHMGELPKEQSKLIASVLKAAMARRSAVCALCQNQNRGTYARLNHTHEKLGREIAKLWGSEWTEEADGERLINPADAIVHAPSTRVASPRFGYGATTSP